MQTLHTQSARVNKRVRCSYLVTGAANDFSNMQLDHGSDTLRDVVLLSIVVSQSYCCDRPSKMARTVMP